MSEQALIPPSALFTETERQRLDAALRDTTAIQRVWLAGFLAGLDSRAAAGAAPAAAAAASAPVAPAPLAAAPLLILFASESGNCEKLAHRAGKLARKLNLKPRVADLAEFDLAGLEGVENLLVVAATWGEGDAPARSVRNYAKLMADGAPTLAGTRFAVLGLGDTSYAEFCLIGKRIDARLEALGGTRLLDRLDADLDYEEVAARWLDRALAGFAPAAPGEASVAASVPATAAVPTEAVADDEDRVWVAEVVDHVNLNSSRSSKETVHLALGFDGDAPAYEPGDALELYPENDPALVDAVLAAAGLSADTTLRQALLRERDVTTLSAVAAERYSQRAGHAGLQALIGEGGLRAWAEGRQLLDLLEAYPAALTAQDLLDITRKLPPRAYSIASSRREVEDEAHLLIAAVRYRTHGRARAGIASTHVIDRVREGDKLRVRLRRNPRFRLPADPAADILMVGPGTGIAPFRAFTQERRATGATGRSWLFFGDRRFTHDFLYQLEWQEALEDRSLTRLDIAFSRDQPEKIYVQDRIRENRREVVDWLDSGASFFVCGDAKAMAKDVRRAVVSSFAEVRGIKDDAAEEIVAGLERSGRYLQDVY